MCSPLPRRAFAGAEFEHPRCERQSKKTPCAKPRGWFMRFYNIAVGLSSCTIGLTVDPGGLETSIPLVCSLDRHHGENMNLLLCLMDAIECREGMAHMKTIRILPSLNIQAFLIASVTGERVFLKRLQFFHDDPPALRAETPDTLKSLAVNQYPKR